jgi:hypothetical protein
MRGAARTCTHARRDAVQSSNGHGRAVAMQGSGSVVVSSNLLTQAAFHMNSKVPPGRRAVLAVGGPTVSSTRH